jgi:hypothetical protein
VLHGKGDGTLGTYASFPTAATGNATDVAAADLDGDGDADLVITQGPADRISVLRGNGDGSFTAPLELQVGPDPRAVAIGDADGDGILDLAVASWNANWPAAPSISLLRGTGGAVFAPAVSVSVPGRGLSDVAFADLNGDPFPDLVVSISQPSVYVGDGNGSAAVLLGGPGANFAGGVTYGTQKQPRGFVLADLNGDGPLDLAIANSTAKTVTLWRGVGNGTFQTWGPPYRIHAGVGSNPLAVTLEISLATAPSISQSLAAAPTSYRCFATMETG